jgi:thiol-disulfide isomerase/thioredoxin
VGCLNAADPNRSAGPAAPAPAADTIPFPVYLDFDAFEPWLQPGNDTTFVFNFWATWCQPCLAEMPLFERLIAETADQPVRVVLVSMDFPRDILGKLVPFVSQRQLTPYVLCLADLDYNSWIDRVSPAWDGAIPFTLVVNRDRREHMTGEWPDYEALRAWVRGAAGG